MDLLTTIKFWHKIKKDERQRILHQLKNKKIRSNSFFELNELDTVLGISKKPLYVDELENSLTQKKQVLRDNQLTVYSIRDTRYTEKPSVQLYKRS